MTTIHKGKFYRVRPRTVREDDLACCNMDTRFPVQVITVNTLFGTWLTSVKYKSTNGYFSDGFVHAKDLLPLKKKRTGKRKKKLKLRKVSRY